MRRAGLLLMVLVVMPPLAMFAAQSAPASPGAADALQSIPAQAATLIRPRVMAAYGALLAVATLGILYMYRGRAFIAYWIGSWLMLAGGLALLSQEYRDPRLGGALLGLALLLVVWSAGLALLAAEAFPASPLRWTSPARFASVTAVWFLASPFLVRLDLIIATGTIAAAGLLGWAASRYLQRARSSHHAGAFLVGGALALACASNLVGWVLVLNGAFPALTNRLAALNVLISIFVALGMHLLVFEDMTNELQRTNRFLETANEQVKRLAITDPLTGCHNRRFFDEIEGREIERHRRYGAPLTVMFVDANQFKLLNDTLGHDAGDDVLRAIGALLRRHVRQSDCVIRWGGDEFLLLLTCGLKEAEAKSEELKAAFRGEQIAHGLPPYLGLSIGVAPLTGESDSLSEAIRSADAQMYADKLAPSTPHPPPLTTRHPPPTIQR